jgi:AcrR family transcriptional regulator
MQSVHWAQRVVEPVNESLQQRWGEARIQMPLTTTKSPTTKPPNTKPPGTKPRKRLTREESRAQTRATLVAVGRRHFLRYGLGGAVAEKIAEDAGYSRGALYSNFDGKEELFLAVMQEEQACHMNFFRALLKEEPSGKKRLKKMRDAIADLMTDHDWIVLRAEFEAGALRSERLRQSFVEAHRQQIRDGGDLVRDLLRSPEVTSSLKPDDFITVIINLAHGLAVTQRILGAELSPKNTRTLIQSLFDHLISSA